MTMTTNTYTIRLTDIEVEAVAWATMGSRSVKIVGNVMTFPVDSLDHAWFCLALETLPDGPVVRSRLLALGRVRRKLEKTVKECGIADAEAAQLISALDNQNRQC